MNNSRPVKQRPGIAIVAAIVSFAFSVFGFEWLGDSLGVRSRLELDEPTVVTRGSGRESYDEQVSSLTTWFGYMTMGLSAVLASWLGCAAYRRRLDAGWDRNGWRTFRAWAAALLILSTLAVLLDLVTPPHPSQWTLAVRNCVSLGATIGVAVLSYRWWSKPTVELDTHAN